MKTLIILSLIALYVSAGSLDRFIYGKDKVLVKNKCFEG